MGQLRMNEGADQQGTRAGDALSLQHLAPPEGDRSTGAVKRDMIANYLGQAWMAVMGLAFVPLYIRYLGMESYGLIGLFSVMQAWLALLDMGMTPTLNREMARFGAGVQTPQAIRNLLSSIEVLCVGIALTIAVVVWLVSGQLATGWLKAERLPMQTVAHALSIMGLVVALRFVEGIYRGSLFGLQQQVWYNCAASTLATVRHGGAVLVLAWVSPTIGAFFVWQAAVSVLVIVTLGARVHGTLPRVDTPVRFSKDALAGVWRFAVSMFGITLLALILRQADKILLSRLLPLDAFGTYVLATTLAGVLHLAVGPIVQSIYPKMVELSATQDQGAFTLLYHRSARLVTLLTAPVAMLLACFGGGVVYLWSGDPELARSVAPVLLPLAIGTFLNGLMWVPYHCQLAHGWTSLAFKGNIVAILLLIPCILWAAPRYGPTGAAWTWVALNSGYVFLNAQFMHLRLMPAEKWRWYVYDVGAPTLGSVLVGLAFLPLAPAGFEARVAWFGFLAGVGLAALLVTALLTGHLRAALGRQFPAGIQNHKA